jgi:hypothetical protein
VIFILDLNRPKNAEVVSDKIARIVTVRLIAVDYMAALAPRFTVIDHHLAEGGGVLRHGRRAKDGPHPWVAMEMTSTAVTAGIRPQSA